MGKGKAEYAVIPGNEDSGSWRKDTSLGRSAEEETQLERERES